MPRFKPYDYNQLLMVPVSLEDQLVPGTLEYAIHHLLEERVDTTIFHDKYQNEDTGRTAYDPKMLLKVVLLGYSRGMMSSRKLERACKENVVFMALSCGQKPDHSTLAAFISGMGEDRVVSLFTQVLMVCEQEDLLGGTHFSMDGLKLPSNASKEWSGTHKDLLKKKVKLEEKLKEAVREHREEDQSGGDRDAHRQSVRIKRLGKSADRIEKFLQDTPPKQGRQGKEIQSNVTDNQSAKMVSSHGVVQGYNANAMVDDKHQIVVAAVAFGEGDDGVNVAPMLEATKKNLTAVMDDPEPLKGRIVSADTSYYSKINLEACEEEQVDAYIPDRMFRQRDPRFSDAKRHRRSVDKNKQRYASKKKWFKPEDFHLDEASGKLICPAGQGLYRNGRFKKDGYEAVSYRAPAGACPGCALHSKCLRNPKGKFRQVRLFDGKPTGSLTEAMKQKIDTPEGRRIYGRRLANVEPVFGNIRAQKRLDRFTLRGEKKVNVQWTLYCMLHNIEKIGKYGVGWN